MSGGEFALGNNLGEEFIIAHSDDAGAIKVNSRDLNTVTVDTIADLRTLSSLAEYVRVTGYHTKNDGAFGSNVFRLKGIRNTENDNTGTIILSTINDIEYVYELQFSGPVNVKWFGARDGLDSTSSIQKAIDNHNVVFIPEGTFLLGYQTAYLGETEYGVGGILLRAGVTLFGSGDKSILKVKPNAYGAGALYGLVRSNYTSDIEIYNIKFDGNKANQVASTQCSNIFLHGMDNVNIHDCFSINANGQSIQVVGKATDPIDFLYIENNIIDTATSIGIQVSHCNNPVVENNIVIGCTNNAIDIYNEDGDTVVSGKGGSIVGNTTKNSLTGVFIETSSLINVTGNTIENCSSSGIHINRINGVPYNSNVNNNIISGGTRSIRISGVGSGNLISNNVCTGFTEAPILLYGSSCSGVTIKDNTFSFNSATQPFVEISNTALSNVQVVNNRCNTLFGGNDYRVLVTGVVSSTATFIQKPIRIDTIVQKDFLSGAPSINNGQTLTIPLRDNATGTLQLWGTSGGSWYSTATYTVFSGGGTAKVKKINDDFTAPGQLFGAVTVSGLTLSIPTTATGSGGNVKYFLEYL
jgi:hypothetical protein